MNHAVMTEIDLEKKKTNNCTRIQELLRISYQTLTTEDKKLMKAFDVSVEAHKDQRRKSGEIYLSSIAVAKSLLQKLVWALPLLQLHLLHDVVEDPTTIQDIERLFNQGCSTR
jgi:GTP pyrophosphokinase